MYYNALLLICTHVHTCSDLVHCSYCGHRVSHFATGIWVLPTLCHIYTQHIWTFIGIRLSCYKWISCNTPHHQLQLNPKCEPTHTNPLLKSTSILLQAQSSSLNGYSSGTTSNSFNLISYTSSPLNMSFSNQVSTRMFNWTQKPKECKRFQHWYHRHSVVLKCPRGNVEASHNEGSTISRHSYSVISGYQ